MGIKMESVARFIEMNGIPAAGGWGGCKENKREGEGQYGNERCSGYGFQMPLHYPRYKRADYEAMPEWQLDCLLRQYGLPVTGEVEQKRSFAIGAFIWS